MSYAHYSTDCGRYHDLVRDFHGPRPTIVVLCGSTRFSTAFQEANLKETLAGRIVLSIGCDMRSDADVFGDMPEGDLADVKTRLDELHKRKIDLADEVLVLNVGGYIGSSTRSEVEYAEKLGKPVRYLESASLSVSSGEAETRRSVPQQLQNADFSHNCEGLRIWELGDEGGHVIALGHVDLEWMASAILTLSRVNHDKPITKVMLADIHHTTGRIEDTPGGRFDFVTRTGEGLDFKVTEWRLGSGEAAAR
ncbi:hypothetical protein [Streptosporangium sp. V21-05]|uniref:hypothetical protein n=1 Tax=Streptosporangium sp. V21-05 TaxID=3446115 RepID=UPI003F539E92